MIADVRFADCTVRGVESPGVLAHAGNLCFRNGTIEPAKKTAP